MRRVINSFKGGTRGYQVSALPQQYWPFFLLTSSHPAMVNLLQLHPPPPHSHPLYQAVPHVTRVSSQATFVTEEMNLSVSVSDPPEPH